MQIRNSANSSIQIHALASGSSGNSYLVQAAGVNLLIDAGLTLKNLSNQLARRGVALDNLSAILITHEHIDHISGAGPLSRKTGAPLIANAATLQACSARDGLSFNSRELPTCGTIGLGALGIRSFPVPHDAVEPVGYIIEKADITISFFTDAGCRTKAIEEALKGASLAIVEANHDIEWLLRGPYTREMKARVASSTGHLSNTDCADLVADTLEECGPMCIWLAHLSRVNNSASLARRTVSNRIAARTKTAFLLDVALRDHPSVSWSSGARGFQLALL